MTARSTAGACRERARDRHSVAIVNASGIDYEAVFQALPGAVALFTTDLVYADVNEAFLSSMGHTRDQVVGRYLWAAFPDDPKDPAVSGMRKLQDSLRWVAATGERDAMTLHRYDVERPDRPGVDRTPPPGHRRRPGPTCQLPHPAPGRRTRNARRRPSGRPDPTCRRHRQQRPGRPPPATEAATMALTAGRRPPRWKPTRPQPGPAA
ncbi:PAS domain-containing protein [Streptomyces sp. NPDC056663]|uniref:PAS domain-containing protein n=1 Tax=Streptomyces sp. NPDC056663 TaxID=3345899 RepID=UPI0036955E20